MVYIYIFRGTPILVQIFIIYYGLPQLDFIRDGIFWPILREPFGCAILALTLNTGDMPTRWRGSGEAISWLSDGPWLSFPASDQNRSSSPARCDTRHISEPP